MARFFVFGHFRGFFGFSFLFLCLFCFGFFVLDDFVHGMGRDEMGLDGLGLDGMRRDGAGWDGTG